MTKIQINKILGDLGYSESILIKATKISSIATDLEGVIFTGPNTRLKFNTIDSNTGLLEVYFGREDASGN